MRYIFVSLLLVAALFAFSSNSSAVGVYIPGKETCDCSPLVQRGVIPDTWNKLTEALLIPQISWAIDRLTLEAKAVISQFGQPPTSQTAEVSSSKESKVLKDEPLPLVKEKIRKIEKKKKKPVVSAAKTNSKKAKKTDDKSGKPKKRIKAPLKAL